MHGSATLVEDDLPFLWEHANFDPCRILTPVAIGLKVRTVDYVGEISNVPNLVEIRPLRVSRHIRHAPRSNAQLILIPCTPVDPI
jgi:hypothetical protein